MSAERLRRFFTKVERGYQVSKRVRDLCVFAKHNLVTDPPFSQLDLVSCCNVLIYLRQEYQQRAIELFHYALRPDGFLKLGRAETIGASPDLFVLVDKTQKIYAKKLTSTRTPPAFHARTTRARAARRPLRGERPGRGACKDLEQAADRLVMAKYAPVGVLVNEDMTIVQFRGRTAAFIEPPPGDATLNLLKMARHDLVLELRTALHRARRDHRAVRKDGLTTNHGGRRRAFSLQVIPLDAPTQANRHFLVLFEYAPLRRTRPGAAGAARSLLGPGTCRAP